MLARLGAVLFGAMVAAILLELTLQLLPGAIPPRFLLLFEPGLRARIAEGRYPVERDFVEVERDDQGPQLLVPKPESRILSADDATPRTASRRYDEIGFCNPQGGYDGHAEIDLIAVGDSFTWCHSVKASQTWSHRLGALSGRTSYNLGRGGVGPYEYLQLLRRFGLPKRPKTVVMNVYGGNDLRNAAGYQRYRAELRRTGRPPNEKLESLWPALTHGWLGRHSRAANLAVAFATRSWDHATHDRPRDDEDFRYTIELDAGAVRFNVRNGDTDEIEYARLVAQDPALLELWDEALASFVGLSGEYGFDPIVTYSPSAHAAYADRVRFSDASLGPLLAEFDRAQREFLARRAEELGYTFHDLSADLLRAARESDANSLLYDPDDLHWTERGHEVVANSIARILAEPLARPE